eukprot:scaffold40430_cov65-Phaeocystis_antarctica.AAC.20
MPLQEQEQEQHAGSCHDESAAGHAQGKARSLHKRARWAKLADGVRCALPARQREPAPREPTAGPLYAARLITSFAGAGINPSIATSGCCACSDDGAASK